MQIELLKDYLVENKDELTTSILKEKHCPSPVRRIEISKENGPKWWLVIPTEVDRVIQ
jgi:retron-type reverse transcriptase